MGRTSVPLDPSKTGREALELETNLCKRIVGQQEAIREIVGIYQMYLSGMIAPGRPIGNLLFLGPTGSGKTRTVEATAESLLKNARAVIKIDCAEFQHSHEIAKLIGSPPGYMRTGTFELSLQAVARYTGSMTAGGRVGATTRMGASHPFYQRLNQILDEKKFDEYVETICEDAN
jgi:ATP-dependent Clp protease ATP-binding subunit ClpA